MTSPKGYPVEGRLEDIKSLDVNLEPRHTTVVPVGTNRRGMDVVSAGFYEVASGLVVEAGSNSSKIVITGHPIKKGDLIRIVSSANGIQEYEMFINEVLDANTVQLAGAVSADFTAGDTIDVLRSVLPKLAPDGSSLSTLIAPPIQIKKGPNGVFVDTFVSKDTANPNNTVPIPVEVVAASGSPINITAGDLNVQLSHAGANFDSIRVGNGTNIMEVNASGEALVRDAAAITELQAILNKIIAAPSTEAKQDTIITALSSLLTELQAKADLTETQPVSVQSSALPTGAATEATLQSINGKDFATQTTLALVDTKLALIRDAVQLLDNIVNGSNQAEVSIANIGAAASEATLATLAAKDFSTETTLAAMSAKLPATLGQKTSANSLAVTIASDQTPVAQKTLDVINTVNLNFSTSNVTNSGYTELLNTIGPTEAKKVNIFMSAGDPMYLAFGAPSSEVNKMIIPPGGIPHTVIELTIPAGTRLSLKRLDTGTTSSGRIIVNFMG